MISHSSSPVSHLHSCMANLSSRRWISTLQRSRACSGNRRSPLCQGDNRQRGLYSAYFLVLIKMGDYILFSWAPGSWTIPLKDAYFHVKVALKTRKSLCFATAYKYKWLLSSHNLHCLHCKQMCGCSTTATAQLWKEGLLLAQQPIVIWYCQVQS